MILLDTNVVAPQASPFAERHRLAGRSSGRQSVHQRRDLDGAARLEVGARRLRLEEAINSLIPRFKCLPFDEFAARSCARLAEKARRAGLAVSMGDAQIAAIAHSSGIATVATRDTGPFEAMGIQVVNPWIAN